MVMSDTKTSGDIFEREPNDNVPVLNDIGTYNKIIIILTHNLCSYRYNS